MKKRIIIVLVLALFLASGSSVQAKNAPKNKYVKTKKKKAPKIKYVKVKNKRNLKYNNISAKQRLDLYYPKKVKKNNDNPVVIFLHGGSYSAGNRNDHSKENKKRFNKAGYVYVPVGYRLINEKPFPGAADDVKTAIRYLKHNSKKLKINPNKIVVMGYSAGANLGSLVSSTPNVKRFGNERYLYPKVNNRVVGFLGIAGFYDYNAMFQNYESYALMPNARKGMHNYVYNQNDKTMKNTIKKATPMNYVRNIKMPVMLVYSRNDQTVPYTQSVNYCKAIRNTGNKRVSCYQDYKKQHGFTNYKTNTDYKRMINWANRATK